MIYLYKYLLLNNYNIKYSIPYSPLSTLSEEELNKFLEEEQVLEFGHSLEQQIGGQIEAGFMKMILEEKDC
ncbi:hypothetical protein [Clostridium botulinum]|uniref:hypothetical protein n=1 Tax=Clostridium botulinum TaxID=1491 RepID=UPI00211B36DF|nr:hypothetical protein [Clostridium botulinum]